MTAMAALARSLGIAAALVTSVPCGPAVLGDPNGPGTLDAPTVAESRQLLESTFGISLEGVACRSPQSGFGAAAAPCLEFDAGGPGGTLYDTVSLDTAMTASMRRTWRGLGFTVRERAMVQGECLILARDLGRRYASDVASRMVWSPGGLPPGAMCASGRDPSGDRASRLGPGAYCDVEYDALSGALRWFTVSRPRPVPSTPTISATEAERLFGQAVAVREGETARGSVLGLVGGRLCWRFSVEHSQSGGVLYAVDAETGDVSEVGSWKGMGGPSQQTVDDARAPAEGHIGRHLDARSRSDSARDADGREGICFREPGTAPDSLSVVVERSSGDLMWWVRVVTPEMAGDGPPALTREQVVEQATALAAKHLGGAAAQLGEWNVRCESEPWGGRYAVAEAEAPRRGDPPRDGLGAVVRICFSLPDGVVLSYWQRPPLAEEPIAVAVTAEQARAMALEWAGRAVKGAVAAPRGSPVLWQRGGKADWTVELLAGETLYLVRLDAVRGRVLDTGSTYIGRLPGDPPE